MRVYIAGPFFNTEQRDVIEGIEEELRNRGIAFFSPRLCGVLGEVAPEDRAAKSKKFYDKNIEMLEHCDIMVAVVDDFDTGTMFEWGYFSCKKAKQINNKLVSLSTQGHGLNLMLTHSSDIHVDSYTWMGHAVNCIIQGREFNMFHVSGKAVT
jgi:nucleoside 2-deoxyribosyltransferase